MMAPAPKNNGSCGNDNDDAKNDCVSDNINNNTMAQQQQQQEKPKTTPTKPAQLRQEVRQWRNTKTQQ